MRLLLAAFAALLIAVPCSAQLLIAPGGGATIVIVDGDNGKEAKSVGDMFTKAEYQFPLDSAETHFLGVLGFYDGDAFGGFGLRYYRDVVGNGVYPLVGANLSILDSNREFVDELTVLLGVEIGVEIWVPGPGDTSFPLTISGGIRHATIGTEIDVIPLEFSIPLELF